MPTNEIQTKLLDAIDNDYRTLGGMKKFADIPVHKDISSELDELISDQQIKKITKGDLTAYFRADEKPLKFWMNGDGKVAVQFTNPPELAKNGDSPKDAPVPKKRGPYKKKAKTAAKPKGKYTTKESNQQFAARIRKERAEKAAAFVEPEVITAEPVAAPLPPLVTSRFVTFEKGGQLLVAFEGNVFDLQPEEFGLICGVSARLEAFGQEVNA